jgi:hypothetical protein
MNYRINYIAEQQRKELQGSLQDSYQYAWDDIYDNTFTQITAVTVQHNSDTTYTEADFTNLDLESIGSYLASSARIRFAIGDGSFNGFRYTLTVDLTSANTTQSPFNEAEDTEEYFTADIRSTGIKDSRTIAERIEQALDSLGVLNTTEITKEVMHTLLEVQKLLLEADGDLEGAQWIEERELKAINEAESAMLDDMKSCFDVSLDLEQLSGETVLVTSATIGTFITWNGSATFNVYTQDGNSVDCFTNYNIRNLESAMDEAHDWMFNTLKEYFQN